MNPSEVEQIANSIRKLEDFAGHYNAHVLPALRNGTPLPKDCKYCQEILTPAPVEKGGKDE